MPSINLSRIGELSLLEQIREDYGKKSKDILVGIGDDAAVLRTRDEYLLITTDMMVEKVHFDLRFVTAYQVGFKLISVNVSDICAMGGNPLYVLLNTAMSGRVTKEFFDAFFTGVEDAMNLYQVRLIGGDISSADKDMYVSATLIGYTKKYIKRSGAKVGDKIYVTGNLGDSACGLELLKKIKMPVPIEHRRATVSVRRSIPSPVRAGRKSDMRGLNYRLDKLGLSWKTIEPLVRRHLIPVARNPRKISRIASSMIDISDGLLIDLSRLCDESGTGARIYEKNIPVSSGMKRAAADLGINSLELALSGGEDYELLFTVPPGKKVEAIYIGDIIESERVIVDRQDRVRYFSADGYRHFTKQKEKI